MPLIDNLKELNIGKGKVTQSTTISGMKEGRSSTRL